MPESLPINTRTAPGFRVLKFESLGKALDEARRLAQADAAGLLVRHGNWTLGQALAHIAWWADLYYDDDKYAIAPRPPWLIRLYVRLRKKALLTGAMPRGIRIPGIPDGTLGAGNIDTQKGLARLVHAFERLDAAPPARNNLLFGPLSHDEWRGLNRGHAELHLGFFDVRTPKKIEQPIP